MDPVILIAAVVALYVSAALISWRMDVTRKRRRKEQDAAFVTMLLRAAENQTLSDIEVIWYMFRSHFESGGLSLAEHTHISQLLRTVITQLAVTHPGVSSQVEMLPHLRELLARNEEVAQREEARAPFSGAPQPERQLLVDLLELAPGDRTIVRDKLNELAQAITARAEVINRLGEEGHKSLVLARWGLLGTVVFSLTSIALAIWK